MRAKLKIPSHKDWRYTLNRSFTLYHSSLVGLEFNIPYVQVFPVGRLVVKEGYSWDGATLTLNTHDLIVPSLVHDALYQCLREGLDQSYKAVADKIFYQLLLENKVNKILSWIMYKAVVHFAPKSSYFPKGK